MDRAREVDGEAFEGLDGDLRALGRALDEVGDEGLDEGDALIGAEERVFAGVSANGDDELIEEGAAAGDDIEMAEGDRVERAGVDRQVVRRALGHGGLLPGGAIRARGGLICELSDNQIALAVRKEVGRLIIFREESREQQT